jgi:hypothetical protein
VRDNREVGWRLAEFRTLDRFRTPHTFNPPLTFLEACVAVVGALTRIFLGSLLFAVFGAFIWTAWATNHDPWRRTALVLSLFINFCASSRRVDGSSGGGERDDAPAEGRGQIRYSMTELSSARARIHSCDGS